MAGFIISGMTSNAIISSLGKTLGLGTLISIILVMLVLPQLLYIFDGVIQKTYLKSGKIVFRKKEEEEG